MGNKNFVSNKKWGIQSFNLITSSMVAFMLFNFLTTVSVNVFIPAVAELKGMSVATLYNWNTIGNLAAVGIALVIGLVAQKVPIKSLSIFGLFLAGISYCMIPAVPAGLTGFFIATNYIATMFYAQITIGARIGNWFPKRKGEILGIVTSVLIVSSVAILPLYSSMNTNIGIKSTMQTFGILVIIWACINIFLIKGKPADVGLNPENMTQEELEEKNIQMGLATSGGQSDWTYRKLLKKPSFVFSAVGWGLGFIGIMGLSLAIVPMMVARGVSETNAIMVASFAGVFQFAGSIISGFLDTRIGQRFVITLFLALEIIGLAIFGFAPDGMLFLMIIGYYIVMFMMGAPNNLQPSMYLSMAGGNSQTFLLVNSLQTAIAATFRSFSSSIIAFSTSEFDGSYTVAMSIFVVSAIASIILLNIFGFRNLNSKQKEAEVPEVVI